MAISLQSVVYETVTPGDGSDMIDGTAQIKISTYFNGVISAVVIANLR